MKTAITKAKRMPRRYGSAECEFLGDFSESYEVRGIPDSPRCCRLASCRGKTTTHTNAPTIAFDKRWNGA